MKTRGDSHSNRSESFGRFVGASLQLHRNHPLVDIKPFPANFIANMHGDVFELQCSSVERMLPPRDVVPDEIRYRLLCYLNDHPEASQRELARHLGVSLGKINYCLRALIAKGLVKIRNFRGNRKKMAYAYVLTPTGLEEKIDVTSRFLKRKLAEYDSISKEIERLTRELANTRALDTESS